MTTLRNFDEKCSVCGVTSEQTAIMSTNSWGYPDLDLRPPEMQRSTMRYWINECPNCGYVAGNLTDKLQIPKDFLKSEEYLNCDGFDFKSDLAARFYRRHMITREASDLKMSFLNLHHCIWACDDAKDPLARDIRKLAIETADMIIENDDEYKNFLLLMKADFLRRTGQFEQLIEEYESVRLADENSNMVIRCQIEKARQKDDRCYTTEEVFGN